MSDHPPEQVDRRAQILAAINSWPNKPWLVLPGPVDLAPALASHIAAALDAAKIWTSFVDNGDPDNVAVFETVWPQ